VKALADQALAALSPTFDEMHGKVGRPLVPPERPLKAALPMAFDRVRSERFSASSSTTTCSGWP
jgi:hypothetical protein